MKNFLEYKGYLSSVSFSAEDMIFFGKIEGINDLILFEAESVTELQVAFQEAVDDYLNMCKEEGKEAEKTYKGVFNVRVSSTTHREISRIAVRRGVKLNDLVSKSLEYVIKNEENVFKMKAANLKIPKAKMSNKESLIAECANHLRQSIGDKVQFYWEDGGFKLSDSKSNALLKHYLITEDLNKKVKSK